MVGTGFAQNLLDSARIAPEIFELRPDYRALLMVVEGIQGQAMSLLRLFY